MINLELGHSSCSFLSRALSTSFYNTNCDVAAATCNLKLDRGSIRQGISEYVSTEALMFAIRLIKEMLIC
jgi:hypothetical protein